MPMEAPLKELPDEAKSWSSRAREPGAPTASTPTSWWSSCFCGAGASGDWDPPSNLHRNLAEALLCRFEAVVVFPPPRAEERLRRWAEGFSLRGHVKTDHEPIAREHGRTGGAILKVSLAAIARVCRPDEGETGESPISEVDGKEAIRSEPGNNVSQLSSSTDPSLGPAPSTPPARRTMKARSTAKPERNRQHASSHHPGDGNAPQAMVLPDHRLETEQQQGLLSLMSGSPRLQRRCSCGSPSAGGGSCAACESKAQGARSLLLQKKLTVGAADDPLEREADRVADQVMAAPTPSAVSGGSVRIQRFTGQGGGQVDIAPASVERVLTCSGKPLEPALRQDMEERFGHDFSRVRVHLGVSAEQSAQDLNAKAYAVGHNIVFGPGRYAPEMYEGRRLIAHELAHTLQQGSARRGAAEPTVLSRQPAPARPAAISKITPEVEQKLLRTLYESRVNAPPSGNTPREANRTFAAAAIIKPDGTASYEVAYFDEGSAEHAEPQLLRKIEGKVSPGDSVAAAIDQVPCGPNRANCSAVLKAFRDDSRIGSFRVYTVRAFRRDVAPGTSSADAQAHQVVSPKTAINLEKRDLPERFLFEETEFRRVRLPLYRGPSGSPSTEGAAGPVVKPPATAGGMRLANTEDVEADPRRSGGSARLPALGIAAAHLGLDLVRSWLAAQQEEEQLDQALQRVEGKVRGQLADRSAELADLQLANPDKRLYARITLTTERSKWLHVGYPGALGPSAMPGVPDVKLDSLVISTSSLEETKSHRYEIYAYGTGSFETLSYSIKLPLYGKAELRAYLLNKIAGTIAGAGTNDSGDLSLDDEGTRLLNQLKGLDQSIALDAARKRANEERARQEEAKRKEAKLAAAEAASKAPQPQPLTTPFLAPPGPATTNGQWNPSADPFNLSGRLERSDFQRSKDAADAVEAYQARFVRRANYIKAGKLSPEEVKKYRIDVEEWVKNLHAAYDLWRTKGSEEWDGVKRIKYVNWWVEQPEGRAALLR